MRQGPTGEVNHGSQGRVTVPEKQMAATRYGQIHHGNICHNNIKFPSRAAREKFAESFEKYHNSHDHDGEVPRFEMVKASDIKSYEQGAKDYDAVTIDGYEWHEIKKYHHREHDEHFTHYRVPTCCVSPIIVLDTKAFIDSGTLERHELSGIFGDMLDDEFQHLVKSIETDGFMDYVIRTHEGKILDGWHRYRAALALNLVRKLMFYPWDEKKEGAAVAFVAARNIERRHLSASQRAQIVVSLNERFGWGGDRSKTPNDALKTKKELAKEAKVGTSTIDRAVKVEKAGKSEAVISGEKSANQVIEEETVKDLWQKVSDEMPKWRQRYKGSGRSESHYVSRASKSTLINALRVHRVSDAEGAATVEELKDLLKLMKKDAFVFIFQVRKVMQGDEEPDAEGSASETASESSEAALPELRDTWHCVRGDMFRAFDASDLTLEPEGQVGDDNPYQRTLAAFVKAVENRHLGMDLYGHPKYEGFYGDPRQNKAYVREIEIYEQLTADIQSKVDWVVDALKAEPKLPEPELETEDDTPIIDLSSNASECRSELRRILGLQGELNKGNMDYSDLCFRYKLTKKQVQEIADSVREAAFKSATERHNEYSDQITRFWLYNTNLSDEMGLDELQAKLVKMFDLRELAFEKKFHGLSLREIQEEAKKISEIYNDLTKPESELLKKVIGAKMLVGVLVSYADDDGEMYQSYFSDEGEGEPLEKLPIVVRMAFERLSRRAEPFEGTQT